MQLTKLTSATEYGIAALLSLGHNASGLLSAADICRSPRMPERYVLQVMRKLVRAGLVHGSRGKGGGYTLAKPLRQISVLDVARAIHGSASEFAARPPLTNASIRLVDDVMTDIAAKVESRLGRIKLSQL